MLGKALRQRRYLIGLSVSLLALTTVVFWQTSLNFGEFRPEGIQQTLVLWGISTLVFLGMVTLGFILFRNVVKLYIERRENRLGSRIKTMLVAGALGLTTLPVVFLFFFSFSVLNRTLDKWFNQPIEALQEDALRISKRLEQEAGEKAATLAGWMGSLQEVRSGLSEGSGSGELARRLGEFAREQGLCYAAVVAGLNEPPLVEYAAEARFAGMWRQAPKGAGGRPATRLLEGDPEVALGFAPAGRGAGTLAGWRLPRELSAGRQAIEERYRSYKEQARGWRSMRYFYVGMLALITVFILFVATWIALLLSRQIVAPIEALAQATAQVSGGRLDYRIETRGIDELGMLVRSFNEMTAQLEHSRDELNARRRYTEALLESIPTGVISLSAAGEILRVNPALGRIFPPERAAKARRLEDLFPGPEAFEVRRLIRRAQRTGLATAPLDLTSNGAVQHLAVTVSALEKDGRSEASGVPRGCVIVIEDTSELLRAQKSAAWQEVAQRVAHEIKNPLTPIALSAERMSRLVDRRGNTTDPATRLELDRLLRSSAAAIVREAETLKTLVDEFSQFARFPTARPEPGDLNEVVETALETCDGRLEGLLVRKQLATELPPVALDREQFRRAVVNLLDNAIEAMSHSPGVESNKTLSVTTTLGAAGDTVELAVADTGQGIAPEDREKLFLPYFSTRRRGTGLGLAIVSRILAEHKATIRVEDNQPRGARFIVEIAACQEAGPRAVTAGERAAGAA